MGLENLHNAVSTLLQALSINIDTSGIGYYLALIGLLIFLAFAVGATAWVASRLVRRIADMTPGEFMRMLFIVAGILVFLGAVIP